MFDSGNILQISLRKCNYRLCGKFDLPIIPVHRINGSYRKQPEYDRSKKHRNIQILRIISISNILGISRPPGFANVWCMRYEKSGKYGF